MNQLVDNLAAFRILYLLTRQWDQTDAFKLGIVDKDGKQLKTADELTTSEEKDAYNYLTRLVFNLKRLIAKVPGGKSMLGSLVAAYFLIKEGVNNSDLTCLEEKFIDLMTKLNEGVILVEEEILVLQFLELMNEDGVGVGGVVGTSTAPANSMGGGGVAVKDNPMKLKKRNNWKSLRKAFGITSFEVSERAYNGFTAAKTKGAKWDSHLVPSNEDKDAYDQIKAYSKAYSNRPIAIKRKDIEQYTLIKH